MSAADELQKLDEAATSGPWIPDFDDDYPSPLRAGEDVLGIPVICYGPPHTDPADLALIATLRNALPEIIAVVEAADDIHTVCGFHEQDRLTVALDALSAKLNQQVA